MINQTQNLILAWAPCCLTRCSRVWRVGSRSSGQGEEALTSRIPTAFHRLEYRARRSHSPPLLLPASSLCFDLHLCVSLVDGSSPSSLGGVSTARTTGLSLPGSGEGGGGRGGRVPSPAPRRQIEACEALQDAMRTFCRRFCSGSHPI
jgi:hypothetical protein